MSSPPPSYNLAVIPKITTRDAFYEFKQHGGLPKPKYEDIRVPYNTASGIYIAAFAFAACFAFVWHIIWLAVAGILGVIVCSIARTFNDNIEYTLTAAEVKKIEESRKKHIPPKDLIEGEDMGLGEFIVVAVTWAFRLIRPKRRAHGN